MLTPKEISSLFEVQVNTLYNWRKTKPKLYSYLQNADYNSKINYEINILLESFSKTFSKDFTLEEIDFLIVSEYEFTTIEEVDKFQEYFIKANYKMLLSNHELVLSIYDKLKKLNLVEKYILYKKIYKVRQIGDQNRGEYFSEFISKNEGE